MPLDKPGPPHKVTDMEGGYDHGGVQRREQLASNVLQLTLGCPHDQCNPCFCPLHEIRKLEPAQRADWVRMLTAEDLEYLTTYHEICLHWWSQQE